MFESGVKDYVHFPITLDITFPINRKGEPIISCAYCTLFTGRKCVVTNEHILGFEEFVGHNCPLKMEVSK